MARAAVYLRSEFPNGRSNILMSDGKAHNSELFHFLLVLSDNGVLWVDVFWPYDKDIDTRTISEQEFWETFREWRLRGLALGDSARVAAKLAHKCLNGKLGRKENSLSSQIVEEANHLCIYPEQHLKSCAEKLYQAPGA